MTQLYSFLGEELIHALGWTFVHSLWQGSLIALIMTFVLSRIPTQEAQKRYIIATLSLISVLLSSIVTFAILYQHPAEVITTNDTWQAATSVQSEETSTSLYAWISQFNPFLVSIWIMGVLFFALRFCFGLVYLRHLKTSAVETDGQWQITLDRIVGTLNYSRQVRLAESALLRIPVVVGHLKPVILFPVGIINQLSTDEVEAILAHEVAHLVRNDFIQNLVQSLIEMVFYYHPAVWWISAVVRSERENCCDDLALQLCSNSLTYAKALVRLEDMSYPAPPALALPFAGSKGHLLNRIKRILNQPQNKSNVMERIIATVILIGCVTLLSFTERNTQIRTKPEEADIKTEYHYAITDTVPTHREVTVWKSVDGKEIEMRSQNGEIKSLKINGEIIDPSDYNAHAAEIERMQAVAETPPVPPVPPMPPMPSIPPVPPVPAMPAMPPMPALPPMPPMPDFPDKALFERQFFLPESGHYNKNKTTIIREKSGNGYTYHVESNGNSNITVDSDRGIAIVNGQEIELDADSVIVIETLEDHEPGFLRYDPDEDKMTEAEKAEWEAYEKAMENWGKQWENAAQGKEWDEYNKQMEEWGKQWENQDWKVYEEQMKEYGEQWEKEHAGEWKVYEQQMDVYAQQLAEAEREKAGEYQLRTREREFMDDARLRKEESGQLQREQMDQARVMELEHARILQLDNEGNVMSLRSLRNLEPLAPITRSLDRDGLIDADGEYNIILEQDKLRINGKRMPDDVHEKYLDLFERTQGYRITGKTKIEISNE